MGPKIARWIQKCPRDPRCPREPKNGLGTSKKSGRPQNVPCAPMCPREHQNAYGSHNGTIKSPVTPKSRQLRVETLVHFHFPVLKNFSTKMFVGPQNVLGIRNVLGTVKCLWDPKKSHRSQNVLRASKCPRDPKKSNRLKMSQAP